MSLVTIALAWIAFQPDSQVRLPVTTLGLPKNAPIDFDTGGGWPPCDLSPDGKRIVRIGGKESELYLREIDSFEERKLDDTQAAVLPVFSPDGRWIAYFARDKLWKIAVSGGAPIELFDTFSGPGLCWGQDEIFFTRSDGGGIWRVGASGGEARQVSALDDARDETSHRWPQLLPGGRHLLVTIKTARIATLDDAQIGIVSLETGETESVFTGGSCARYISTGHLVYGRDNELFAFAFDPVTMKVLGTPTRVLERVETVKVNGAAFFAVSPNGTLSYLPKKTTYAGAEPIWISRTGRIVPVDIIDTPGGELFESVASPDGSRLAAMVPAANDKIWIYDLRRRSFSRLTTTPGNDSGPIWSSDSKLIAYSNDRAGNQDAYLIPADGSSPARPILASEFAEVPTSFSPDGRWLAYSLESPTGKADIWVLSLEEGGESRPFVESRELDEQAQFSPNGRWIAYMSTISGSEDIYARPFPGPGGAVRISTSGGNDPMWSLDGSELFYTDKDVLMVVPISWEPAFDPGEPRPLLRFEANVLSRARITADPERFLGNRYSPEDWRRYEIRLVFDWTDRLNAIR
jgi:serine/threonine-protein kinase